jgi:hypothetical protein
MNQKVLKADSLFLFYRTYVVKPIAAVMIDINKYIACTNTILVTAIKGESIIVRRVHDIIRDVLLHFSMKGLGYGIHQ